MIEDITPLILTYNEAPNIGRALAQLRWAREIVVVDSFSDDETVAIGESFRMSEWRRGVLTTTRAMELGSMKRVLPPSGAGVDADYFVTPELIEELRTTTLGDTTDIERSLLTASTAKLCGALSISRDGALSKVSRQVYSGWAYAASVGRRPDRKSAISGSA